MWGFFYPDLFFLTKTHYSITHITKTKSFQNGNLQNKQVSKDKLVPMHSINRTQADILSDALNILYKGHKKVLNKTVFNTNMKLKSCHRYSKLGWKH